MKFIAGVKPGPVRQREVGRLHERRDHEGDVERHRDDQEDQEEADLVERQVAPAPAGTSRRRRKPPGGALTPLVEPPLDNAVTTLAPS